MAQLGKNLKQFENAIHEQKKHNGIDDNNNNKKVDIRNCEIKKTQRKKEK